MALWPRACHGHYRRCVLAPWGPPGWLPGRAACAARGTPCRCNPVCKACTPVRPLCLQWPPLPPPPSRCGHRCHALAAALQACCAAPAAAAWPPTGATATPPTPAPTPRWHRWAPPLLCVAVRRDSLRCASALWPDLGWLLGWNSEGGSARAGRRHVVLAGVALSRHQLLPLLVFCFFPNWSEDYSLPCCPCSAVPGARRGRGAHNAAVCQPGGRCRAHAGSGRRPRGSGGSGGEG